ncbi:unannotated protein [freshwater metagenome]|uniref:Unannotated protein n=1 Tax=freshwater metagenome TaxID=449393 RepID=A0A6J7R7Z1_9ZZZZ
MTTTVSKPSSARVLATDRIRWSLLWSRSASGRPPEIGMVSFCLELGDDDEWDHDLMFDESE